MGKKSSLRRARLDQFRRSAIHDSPAVSPAAMSCGNEESFEVDVRNALRIMKADRLQQVADGGDDATEVERLSVSAVLKFAGRGRTQLYVRYRHLLDEIEAAQGEIDRAIDDDKRRRRQSKASLRDQLVATRKDAEHRIAVIASTQLTELLAKLGPGSRRQQVLTIENAALKRRITELEQTVANQAALLRQVTGTSGNASD